MCGILGYAMRDGAAVPGDLREAIAGLAHRGPDDHGLWAEGGTALGFVRLSIIDLSPAGHQPMASPDGRYWIVFNGEIYNFPELRAQLESSGESFVGHSDTEILLRLFLRDGFERCLQQLRGMFAFAVWDRQTRTLSLARDRLGVKPLVYAETERGLLFASEIAALYCSSASRGDETCRHMSPSHLRRRPGYFLRENDDGFLAPPTPETEPEPEVMPGLWFWLWLGGFVIDAL